jgi:ribosomal protein L37E
MPYLDCPRCGMTNFTAAYVLDVEHCARCGIELPRPPRIDAANAKRREEIQPDRPAALAGP